MVRVAWINPNARNVLRLFQSNVLPGLSDKACIIASIAQQIAVPHKSRSDRIQGTANPRAEIDEDTYDFIGNAAAHWIEETQHIARVWIDPRNSDHVLIAALGHAYGPNPDRGIFRTNDGGKTWTKSSTKMTSRGRLI